MNKADVLDLKIESDDHPEDLTIRGYLHLLLTTLWEEGESFNGKRPFGNSGWEYDLYLPLVKADVVNGTLDEDGYLDECDNKSADALVFELINECFFGDGREGTGE